MSCCAAAGAALYAQSPCTVYARRCRFAYGVDCSTAWHRDMPRELKYIEPTTQETLCMHMFKSMVSLDELIEHDQVMHCHQSLHDVCHTSDIQEVAPASAAAILQPICPFVQPSSSVIPVHLV